MGQKEKKAYLLAICKRYYTANRLEKGKILDEYCSVCGYNRKYAIRRLGEQYQRLWRGDKRKTKPGRKPKYTADELLEPLKRIWFASGQICSKYLKPALELAAFASFS